MVGFEFLGGVVVALSEHDLLHMPAIIVVFELDLHTLVEEISLFSMLVPEVGHCLLYLLVFVLVPRSELLVVKLLDLVLDQMGLCEATLMDIDTLFVWTYDAPFPSGLATGNFPSPLMAVARPRSFSRLQSLRHCLCQSYRCMPYTA